MMQVKYGREVDKGSHEEHESRKLTSSCIVVRTEFSRAKWWFVVEK